MLKSKQIKYLKWFITWTENRITMPLQSILNAVCSSVSFLRLEDSKKKNQCIGQCEKQEKFPYKQQLCRLEVFRLSICVTYITHTYMYIWNKQHRSFPSSPMKCRWTGECSLTPSRGTRHSQKLVQEPGNQHEPPHWPGTCTDSQTGKSMHNSNYL